MTAIPYGVSSNVAPLEAVLMQPPGAVFGSASDDPAVGFLHRVDLAVAEKQHQRFRQILGELGVAVHDLGAADHPSPDSVYTYDPSWMTATGAILLRCGKDNRLGEESVHQDFYLQNQIPIVGAIESPGTVDGGDVFYLREDLMCIGRSLRTNRSGAAQLAELVGADCEVFDVPYADGPSRCLHLMSVISPVADDLAVVFPPLLPSGLWELLSELGYKLIEVPEEEMATLGCNVLAVRPGVAVMLEGNPVTGSGLAAAGVEIHSFDGSEICINGSGGPTCLTRPIKRSPS